MDAFVGRSEAATLFASPVTERHAAGGREGRGRKGRREGRGSGGCLEGPHLCHAAGAEEGLNRLPWVVTPAPPRPLAVLRDERPQAPHAHLQQPVTVTVVISVSVSVSGYTCRSRWARESL
eukprot:544694-Pyramimonas_sp.AAC.1